MKNIRDISIIAIVICVLVVVGCVAKDKGGSNSDIVVIDIEDVVVAQVIDDSDSIGNVELPKYVTWAGYREYDYTQLLRASDVEMKRDMVMLDSGEGSFGTFTLYDGRGYKTIEGYTERTENAYTYDKMTNGEWVIWIEGLYMCYANDEGSHGQDMHNEECNWILRAQHIESGEHIVIDEMLNGYNGQEDVSWAVYGAELIEVYGDNVLYKKSSYAGEDMIEQLMVYNLEAREVTEVERVVKEFEEEESNNRFRYTTIAGNTIAYNLARHESNGGVTLYNIETGEKSSILEDMWVTNIIGSQEVIAINIKDIKDNEEKVVLYNTQTQKEIDIFKSDKAMKRYIEESFEEIPNVYVEDVTGRHTVVQAKGMTSPYIYIYDYEENVLYDFTKVMKELETEEGPLNQHNYNLVDQPLVVDGDKLTIYIESVEGSSPQNYSVTYTK